MLTCIWKSRVECTLGEFADNTKLSGADNALEGRGGIQKDLDRLERWTYVTLMKYNKAKCKVLAHGSGQSQAQYMLGREWIESSPEEDLGVLVDEKLSMAW